MDTCLSGIPETIDHQSSALDNAAIKTSTSSSAKHFYDQNWITRDGWASISVEKILSINREQPCKMHSSPKAKDIAAGYDKGIVGVGRR